MMKKTDRPSRRSFVKLSTLGALGSMPMISTANSFFEPHTFDDTGLQVNIFSKHLQFLDYKNTGAMAAELGFSGVDLTVRPKGHVLPEMVKSDLPKAISAIKQAGSDCTLITTNVERVTNQLDLDIIKTAAASGVKFYRPNWYKFTEGKSMDTSMEIYQYEIEQLSKLNASLGIIGAYQNHAGTDVGASFWELDSLMKKADPKGFGIQYDIRHAVVEGGYSWVNGLELLKAKIKVIVLKDFKWGKVNGKWNAVNVPIGEGMVDFDTYFKLLKKYQLKPPVSLHLEYELGGAEKGRSSLTVDPKVVYDAMKKDLKSIQKLWKEA